MDMRGLRRWPGLGVLAAIVAWTVLLAPSASAPMAAAHAAAPMCSVHSGLAQHGGTPSDPRHALDCCLLACCAAVAALLPGIPALPPRSLLSASAPTLPWRAVQARAPQLAFAARAPPEIA